MVVIVSDNSNLGLQNVDSQTRQPFLINEILVNFFVQSKIGYAGLERLSACLGMKAIHLKTYQKKQLRVLQNLVKQAEECCSNAASIVRQNYGAKDDDEIIDISVLFDGSWHTRGYRSKLGFAAIIDADTGLVLDYQPYSKYCHACAIKLSKHKEDSAEFRTWYEAHKPNCDINFTGSSGAMEVQSCVEMFRRSLEKHKIRYTSLLSDGDSKAYNAVVEDAPYGKNKKTEHQECNNHAHKRHGTALRKARKDKKLGGRGKLQLTIKKCENLQAYYRAAIAANVGNPEAMRVAVWATLLHTMSTDEDPHHDYCPKGQESWCFYNKALALGETPVSHTTRKGNISYKIASELVPIYERMSNPELMKRLAKGVTQNPNESLHQVLHSRCPKASNVGFKQWEGMCARSVCDFNMGSQYLLQNALTLGLEANEIMVAYAEKKDRIRIKRAEKAMQEGAKRRRTALQRMKKIRKQKAANKKDYCVGAF